MNTIPALRCRLSFRLVVALTVASSVASAAAGQAPPPPVWVDHPLKPFAIMATEVTVADFLACVKDGKCSQQDVDPVCNVADPLKTDHPVNCITHDGAATVCEYLGGRLCDSQEWLAACRGTDNRAFPYGAEFHQEACNIGSYASPPVTGKGTVAVASMPGCEGGLPGLFDIGGNVSEWMSDCKDNYCKFRGGAYVSNDPIEYFGGCADRCSGNDRGLRSGSVGARCCRDRTLEAAPKASGK